MAFNASNKTRVLLGSLNLSCEARDVNISQETDMLDITTLCDEERNFLPGRDMASFSASGPLDVDTTTNAPYDVLTDWKAAAAQPLTYAPSGLAADETVFMIDARQSAYETTSQNDGTADYSVAAMSDGTIDVGTSLEDLAAVTVDTNGTARDGGASSSNGGVGHIHVTAFSGLTSNDVTIEQSANGTTGWTTVLTFSQITGVGSERVEITGSVARYLRVVDDVDGTGSCTRQVSFARR